MRWGDKERFTHINVGMLILIISISLLFVIAGCSLNEGDPGPTVTYNDITSPNIGLLKVVPAGSFQRDSTPTNISVITSAFRMSEKEITRAQFLTIMGTDPSETTYSSGTDDPVQMTNWYHAIAFCNKLSIAEGLTPAYSVTGVNFSTLVFGDIPTVDDSTWNAAAANWYADGYRLPTELEWMWAAMGATSGSGYTSPTYLTGYGKLFAGSNSTLADGSGGTNSIGDYAWYSLNSGIKTHPVGTTGGTTDHANELGLYDMSGNVFEWNWDWHHSPYPAGTLTDYRGAASGTNRVSRGGSWTNSASLGSVAYRNFYFPYFQYSGNGFRVVRP